MTGAVPGRSLELSVAPDAPALPLPDGPLRPIPDVIGEDGQLFGELIAWVHSGRLTGMEQPWFTDEPPTMWPEARALDFT